MGIVYLYVEVSCWTLHTFKLKGQRWYHFDGTDDRFVRITKATGIINTTQTVEHFKAYNFLEIISSIISNVFKQTKLLYAINKLWTIFMTYAFLKINTCHVINQELLYCTKRNTNKNPKLLYCNEIEHYRFIAYKNVQLTSNLINTLKEAVKKIQSALIIKKCSGIFMMHNKIVNK